MRVKILASCEHNLFLSNPKQSYVNLRGVFVCLSIAYWLVGLNFNFIFYVSNDINSSFRLGRFEQVFYVFDVH
jgi:hypothetical protein